MSYCRIRATGRGAFPIDMLRFLQAWPATSEDAVKLSDSQLVHFTADVDNIERSIVLETHNRHGDLQRFQSFGWRAELMDRFGTHPMQGPSQPVADVPQQVREPMTPELVELRERMELRERANPYPSGSMREGWQRGYEGRPMLALPGSDYARAYAEGRGAKDGGGAA
jgi:hypothetical protein